MSVAAERQFRKQKAGDSKPKKDRQKSQISLSLQVGLGFFILWKLTGFYGIFGHLC